MVRRHWCRGLEMCMGGSNPSSLIAIWFLLLLAAAVRLSSEGVRVTSAYAWPLPNDRTIEMMISNEFDQGDRKSILESVSRWNSVARGVVGFRVIEGQAAGKNFI